MVKVLIRTEGHVKLGMGNIYRCIRIAKKIKEKHDADIQFIVEPTSIIGLKKILDSGFKVDLVNFSNIKQYIKYIRNYKPDVVINDILNLEEDYVKELKKLDTFVVNFEDKEISVTRDYADIIFNSLYKDKENRENYYYGPKYAPLRDSFKNIKKKKINKECKDFLLAFGGSDPSGFTLKVSKILNKIGNIHAIMFLGPSFSNHDQLYDLLKYLNKDKFTIRYDIEYSPIDFEKIDIAIASGGNTYYELAAAGIPTISMCQNKLEGDRELIFKNYGTVIDMGDGNDLTEEDLIKAIKKLMNNYDLRKTMSENGQKLVDGYGVDRIIEIIFDKLKNNI